LIDGKGFRPAPPWRTHAVEWLGRHYIAFMGALALLTAANTLHVAARGLALWVLALNLASLAMLVGMLGYRLGHRHSDDLWKITLHRSWHAVTGTTCDTGPCAPE
jgi:hypothetical protein